MLVGFPLIVLEVDICQVRANARKVFRNSDRTDRQNKDEHT